MDTRGGIVLTGILASSLALSGCLTYNGSREVVPFFELQTRAAKLGGAAMASPADAESGTAKTTEVVFRPLGSFESIGKERARLKLLWPIFDFARGAGHHRSWIMPFVFFRQRPATVTGEGETGSDFDFMIFPFLYTGHEPKEGGYFALFPLAGVLKGLLAKDRIYFFLFPLYWHTFKDDWNSLHLVVPFYNLTRGETHRGWRILPFYGHFEADTPDGRPRYRRDFVLWPFYIHQKNQLNSGRPTKTFFSLPFYGHSHNVHTDTRVYLWPFFHVTEDVETGHKLYFGGLLPYRFTHGHYDLWPIFGVKNRKISTEHDVLDNRGITLPGGWMGINENQLASEGAVLEKEITAHDFQRTRTRFRQFFLWPIQQYEHAQGADLNLTRFYLLPFFWHFWTERKGEQSAKTESEWKLWPIFRARSDGDRRSFYLPSPLWFREENTFERLYARLWRVFLYESNFQRSGWELFYGLLSHRYEKESDRRTFSIFYGLLEATTSSEGLAVRLFWLPWE